MSQALSILIGKCKSCHKNGQIGDLCANSDCKEKGLHYVYERSLEYGADELIGRSLDGEYVLVDEIGSGSFGKVYLGIDTSLFNKVAIKVITSLIPGQMISSASIDSSDARQRFIREARAMSVVTHPHAVGMRKFGESKFGSATLPYIIMEYLDGTNFYDVLFEESEYTPEDVRRFFKEILTLLYYAHSKSVIHRDIKPGNIMVVGRSIKVMDFGIAKAFQGARDELRDLTIGNMFVGTPRYAAPEQILHEYNENIVIDQKVDLYAVGMMLIEYWTKREDIWPRQQRQTIEQKAKHHDETIMKLVRTTFNDDRREFLVKALSKDPSSRFQSASEMSIAVDKLSSMEPLETALPPAPQLVLLPSKNISTVQKKKTATVQAAILLGILLVLLVILLILVKMIIR